MYFTYATLPKSVAHFTDKLSPRNGHSMYHKLLALIILSTFGMTACPRLIPDEEGNLPDLTQGDMASGTEDMEIDPPPVTVYDITPNTGTYQQGTLITIT